MFRVNVRGVPPLAGYGVCVRNPYVLLQDPICGCDMFLEDGDEGIQVSTMTKGIRIARMNFTPDCQGGEALGDFFRGARMRVVAQGDHFNKIVRCQSVFDRSKTEYEFWMKSKWGTWVLETFTLDQIVPEGDPFPCGVFVHGTCDGTLETRFTGTVLRYWRGKCLVRETTPELEELWVPWHCVKLGEMQLPWGERARLCGASKSLDGVLVVVDDYRVRCRVVEALFVPECSNDGEPVWLSADCAAPAIITYSVDTLRHYIAGGNMESISIMRTILLIDLPDNKVNAECIGENRILLDLRAKLCDLGAKPDKFWNLCTTVWSKLVGRVKVPVFAKVQAKALRGLAISCLREQERERLAQEEDLRAYEADVLQTHRPPKSRRRNKSKKKKKKKRR